MRLIVHTPECTAQQKQLETDRQAWLEKWPDHCTTCKGVGGTVTSQNHPYGDTTVSEDLFEECPECVASFEICPRCGHALGFNAVEDRKACAHCHWNWGANADDSLPELLLDMILGCCMDPDLGETVAVFVYRFDELSPEAKKVAIRAERRVITPQVQEMVEAYATQQFPGNEIAYVDYPWKQVVADINSGTDPRYGNRVQINFMTTKGLSLGDVARVQADIAEEILVALSDEKVIEHIKADNLRFLADGTLWLYADKETS
jgi:hypothetical protein